MSKAKPPRRPVLQAVHMEMSFCDCGTCSSQVHLVLRAKDGTEIAAAADAELAGQWIRDLSSMAAKAALLAPRSVN